MKHETWRDLDGRGWSGLCGKPRPAVIVQDDRFDANDSIVVCPLTTDPTQAPIFRLSVQPSAQSGLRAPCRMMVDKLTAVPRRRLGWLVGSLASEDVKALNRAIFVFLGLSETEGPQD
jgi:mRNA interferase MazF